MKSNRESQSKIGRKMKLLKDEKIIVAYAQYWPPITYAVIQKMGTNDLRREEVELKEPNLPSHSTLNMLFMPTVATGENMTMEVRRIIYALKFIQGNPSVLTAWAEEYKGPGWSNRLVWALLQEGNNNGLSLFAFQPEDQTSLMQALFDVSAACAKAFTNAVHQVYIDQGTVESSSSPA